MSKRVKTFDLDSPGVDEKRSVKIVIKKDEEGEYKVEDLGNTSQLQEMQKLVAQSGTETNGQKKIKNDSSRIEERPMVPITTPTSSAIQSWINLQGQAKLVNVQPPAKRRLLMTMGSGDSEPSQNINTDIKRKLDMIVRLTPDFKAQVERELLARKQRVQMQILDHKAFIGYVEIYQKELKTYEMKCLIEDAQKDPECERYIKQLPETVQGLKSSLEKLEKALRADSILTEN